MPLSRIKSNSISNPVSLTQPVIDGAGYSQYQYRNKIINGDFSVWQRGTSGSLVGGPGYVSADRWKIYVNSSTTMTLSRQTFTPGQTEVPGNPTYYARFDWLGTGASQFFSFEQAIEGVHHGAGDYLTISFYARTEQGDDMTLAVTQKFGTGGSSDVTVTNTPLSIDTTWKKFVVTVAVPSISGKTIGTDNHLLVTWFRSGTLNSYLDIADVQVEVGQVATPFERRPPALELALCQRYFYSVTLPRDTNLFYPAVVYVGATGTLIQALPVTLLMRTTPTASTIIGTAKPTFIRYDYGTSSQQTITSIFATVRSTSGTYWMEVQYVAVGSWGSAGHSGVVSWDTGTSSVITLSAEL